MNFSDNLKKIRKEHHLSQEQLADKLGVSRQSVSKWESSLAYPEMDKLIQISKLFQVNLDDLLNCDIEEKNKEIRSKNSLNKYIDSFLDFITKTVEMFTRMSFKSKLKCIFEQTIIFVSLLVVFLLIGLILSSIMSNIFVILPTGIENVISSLFYLMYFIIALVIGMILLTHIFKNRYLDYFEITSASNSNDSKTDEKSNLELNDKKEKIVIRDPKDSDYKFIKGLMSAIVIFFKIFLGFTVLVLCISLVFFLIAIICSFLIIKTKILFVGILLALLSCISVNIIFLIILINIIINRKNNKKLMLYIFIISLVLCGIGGGFTAIGFTKFDYITDMNLDFYRDDEEIIPMQNNLLVVNYEWLDSLEFIEENRPDLRVVIRHPKSDISKIVVHDNYFHLENQSSSGFEMLKDQINYINQFKIVDYKLSLKIYTSKENIEKLKNNIEKQEREDQNSLIQNYEQTISDLETQVDDLKSKLEESEIENELDEME